MVRSLADRTFQLSLARLEVVLLKLGRTPGTDALESARHRARERGVVGRLRPLRTGLPVFLLRDVFCVPVYRYFLRTGT